MESKLQQYLNLFGDSRFLQASVLLAASIFAAALIERTLGWTVKAWARKTETDLDDRLIRLLQRPIFLSVVLGGLFLALRQLGIAAESLELSNRLLKTVAIVIWAVFVIRACSLLLEILSRFEKSFTAIQPRTVSLFDQILKILLVGGAVYGLFLIWGVDVGAYLAGAGIVGIAVGFAAKDTLSNMFSGIFILADAPYQVGDFVVLDSGERGMVTQIGLRSTRILTRDDVEITIPNAVIANSKIINQSGGRWEKQRLRVKLDVAYGTDIDRVREVLLAVAHGHPDIADDPEPRVRLRSFGDSGLNFELLGWIEQPVLHGRVLDALNAQVYKRFAAEGIEIPFPKRDVYLRRSETAP